MERNECSSWYEYNTQSQPTVISRNAHILLWCNAHNMKPVIKNTIITKFHVFVLSTLSYLKAYLGFQWFMFSLSICIFHIGALVYVESLLRGMFRVFCVIPDDNKLMWLEKHGFPCFPTKIRFVVLMGWR